MELRKSGMARLRPILAGGQKKAALSKIEEKQQNTITQIILINSLNRKF